MMNKDSITILLINYDKQQLGKLLTPPLGMLEVDITYDIEPSKIADMELDLSGQKTEIMKQLKIAANSNKVILICGNKAYITCREWAECQLPASPCSVRLSRINKLVF
jgi:hypothetical protein